MIRYGYQADDDQRRLARVIQELDEMQGQLANSRYDRRQLDDVIASLQRVLQQNRLAQGDGDLLNDDLTVIALLTFVLDYGLLFWAEQRVTSGIAAVLLATIPGFMALCETVMLPKTTAHTSLSCRASRRAWRRRCPDEQLASLGGDPINGAGALALSS